MAGMGKNKAVILAEMRGTSVPDHSSAVKEANRSENGILSGKTSTNLKVVNTLTAGVVDSVDFLVCRGHLFHDLGSFFFRHPGKKKHVHLDRKASSSARKRPGP